MRHIGLVLLVLCGFPWLSHADIYDSLGDAPGAPGLPSIWASARKDAIGTAFDRNSPVWFTLADGILTDVFYPTVDRPQVADLQFLVTDGKSFFSEQSRDTTYEIHWNDPKNSPNNSNGMAVSLHGRQRDGAYLFEQTFIADSSAPVIRVLTKFTSLRPGLKVFLLFHPAMGGSSVGNEALATRHALFARSSFSGQSAHAALVLKGGFGAVSAGYVGFSDGWQQLSRDFELTTPWASAGPGNVALTGEIPQLTNANPTVEFEYALGFGGSQSEAFQNSAGALARDFHQELARYNQGWATWIENLMIKPEGAFLKTRPKAQLSTIVLKMHEDKQNPGAFVAALATPGIPAGENAPEENRGGYHLVWPRDLFHAANALLAAGDTDSAISTLHYFSKTQRSDGAWHQNFWVDGTPYWTGLQLDQVAFPILLAEKLHGLGFRFTDATRPEFSPEIHRMVGRAAAFIESHGRAHGPTSPQDRWEEIGGYLPSSIAAQISALRAATRLLGNPEFSSLADAWADNIENWTLYPGQPFSSALRNPYYLRVSPSGNPRQEDWIWLANGAGAARASEILDGGFLELVRLGVRPADHEAVRSTLIAYDGVELGIASGAGHFRRYNRDRYGHQNTGGYWPILTGERAHYELARGNSEGRLRALELLQIMENMAMPSGLLPEQVVDPVTRKNSPLIAQKIGRGVPAPLMWSHAEHLLLHRSLHDGVVFDWPQHLRH